jgi:chaperonin GroES
MKTKVFPTSSNIFVKRLEAVTTTDGGIVVPDTSVDKPSEGIIYAIGPEILTEARRTAELTAYLAEDSDRTAEGHYMFYEQTFNLGDHVMFGKFAGIDVTVDDQTFVKLLPDEIFCVLVEVDEPTDPETGSVVEESDVQS